MSRQQIILSAVLDLITVAGFVAVGYGLWLVYEPLAWLWLGVVLLVVSLTLSRGTDGPDRRGE